MDLKLKEKFSLLWKKYFNDAELPITLYYTDETGHAKVVKTGSVTRCIMGALVRVRRGNSLCFDVDSVGCRGGKRYLGFTQEIAPDFEYFLSYGIPDKVRGERYSKSPELVREMAKNTPEFEAPSKFVVFKRWDMLEEPDNPEVVIFFAQPDVLSGLFTLTRYEEAEPNAVISPFGAGCSTIVRYPYLEREAEHPRGVIGTFDPSARRYVPRDMLTFAVPMTKFVRMVEDMEESFLITDSWRRVQKRIK